MAPKVSQKILSQNILLRFEFYRQTNRVQIWAYKIDAPQRMVARAKTNLNAESFATRRRVREIQNQMDNDNDYFVACPALSNPTSVDFDELHAKSNSAMDTNNSVQLLLSRGEQATNCYYFLQIVSNFNKRTFWLNIAKFYFFLY